MLPKIDVAILLAMRAAGHTTLEYAGGTWHIETLLNGGREMVFPTTFASGVSR